jgi:hypothetical protein
MSQKAWMNAYTKGSKSLQARLAKVHAKNPEFQEFMKQHGMGANLSVKQSGIQKKSVATVKPVTDASPEKNVGSREAMIKAAAEKIRGRRLAASNRSAFGGELGGGFSMPGGGFRRYSEEVSLDEASLADKIRAHPGVDYYGGKDDDHMVNLKKGWHMGDGQRSFGNANVRDTWHDLKKVVKFKKGEAKEYGLDESVAANFRAVVPGLGKLQAKNRALDLDSELEKGILNKTMTRAQRMAKAKHIERFARVASGGNAFRKEDIAYKDGTIKMYKGGWIAMRDGKRLGTNMPVKQHAMDLLDRTRKSLGQKTMEVLKKKSMELARGLGHNAMAVEAVSGVSYEGLKRLSKKPTKAEREYMKNDPENQASFERIRKSFAKRANVAYLGGKKVRTESAANRRRIRSWDSAVLPVEHDHAMTTPHPKKKLDALRAAGKHEEARELERSWLRKSMAKSKTENSNE